MVLGGALLGFAGAMKGAGDHWVDAVGSVQLLPAAIAAAGGGTIAAAAVAIVLLLTLLFGRVYCSLLCPLGLCMDVAARLAGKAGKNRRLPYKHGHTWVRGVVLVVLLGSLAAGTPVILGFMDPFSLFGRMTAATVRPATSALADALAAARFGRMSGNLMPAATVLWIGLGLMVVVLGLAVWRGRLWCNTVCPVGTVLGLISRFSLFGLRIQPSSCVSCAQCEKVCPSQCIDFRSGTVDHSRCVMCMKCTTICRKSAVNFVWLPGRNVVVAPGPQAPVARRAMPSSPPVARRGFLIAIATLAGRVTAEDEESGEDHGERAGEGERRGGGRGRGRGDGRGRGGDNGSGESHESHGPRVRTLPPGAGNAGRFHDACTACHLCVARCKGQVLRPALAENGWRGFLQPIMDLQRGFCADDCHACGDVCPTGAILPLSHALKRATRIGTVKFRRGRCVVKREDKECAKCADVCPTGAIRMVSFRGGLEIPEVDDALCNGCGACEFVCPASPEKAITVDGVPSQSVLDTGR